MVCTATAACAQHLQFTQTIKGVVIDEQSGNILSNVTVMIEGGNTSIAGITDTTGAFKLKNVPIGRQAIRASYIGYEDVVIRNIEVTSSKEVILDIRLKEKISKLQEVIVTADRQKNRPVNEAAVVSARQLSMDEAVRYSGTRNDPSRMAQNFAGVSGTNDARNDIIIRGNSSSGVLWRMDGIDIPNPNHFSTLGSTGGPVTILNTNTLKNSDFLTGAFPAQYGNALAGVFDLRMRSGNNEKYEFLAQAGFNGFEFASEGPLTKEKRSSFLVDYRYSLVATIQALGLDVGTGSSTPYYQDVNFKVNVPTRRAGSFSWFGLGGESHIDFNAGNQGSLYLRNGSARDRFYQSLTGVTGFSHQYFFNPNTSGKLTFAVSGFQFLADEDLVELNKPRKNVYDLKDRQIRYSAGYSFNQKISSRNHLTTGMVADINRLSMTQDEIRNGDSIQARVVDLRKTATLLKAFSNLGHRFSDKLSSNLGLCYQWLTLNNTWSIEPRLNIKLEIDPYHSLAFGAGLHSQMQQVYFNQSTNAAGQIELTNKNLDFVRSAQSVIAYDLNFSKYLRLKTEIYGQYIYHAAVESIPSSFSMLNAGADFQYPNKTHLVNNGKGYNYGLEVTLERFLHQKFYFLITASVFESKYKGSDGIWRNTTFNSNYVTNILGGKEFKLGIKSSFGIDTKFAVAGGQRYTPFDIAASRSRRRVVYRENEAYALQNNPYRRWDLKFSYTRNGKSTTQKLFVDLQNITNYNNIYIRDLDPQTGIISESYQIGFFPNINYQITF